MKIKYLISSIFISLSLGCTSLMQKNAFESFDSNFATGAYQAAAQIALEQAGFDEKTGETSDLIWTLQAAAALSLAGNYALSTQLLDASEAFMKKEDTENLAKEGVELAGSLVGNDAMLAYEQTQYDGVMANTIKAWNFIATNDLNNARVELNRAEERQRRAADYFAERIKNQQAKQQKEAGDANQLIAKSINSEDTKKAFKSAGIEQNQWQPYSGYVNPFTTYSYGLNTMLLAKTKSDFAQAADAFKRVYDMTGSKAAKNDLDLALQLSKNPKTSMLDNQVWVIFENGLATVKQERRVDLPIFVFSDNVSYSGLALPVLKARGMAYPSIRINDINTDTISDMDKIIGAEFETEFPYILAREITRATLKTIAQKQAMDADPLLGNAAAILQFATTGADIRIFSALPCEYQAASFSTKDKQLQIKAGNFTLTVDLKPKATKHIIYVKAVSDKVMPLVRVMDI